MARDAKLLYLAAAALGAIFAITTMAGGNTPMAVADLNPADEAQIETVPPENLCAGGLEDGKRIVHELFLKNHWQETTHLGCEVDGGKPVQMPDLPSPVAAATRLA